MYPCVCRQTHEHLCVHAHMYGYECGGQRTTSDFYTQVLFGLVFEKAVNLQIVGLTKQRTLDRHLSLTPQSWDFKNVPLAQFLIT